MSKGTNKINQFSLVCYTKNDLDLLISKDIKRYAYIYHDKDTKEPHYHLFISTLNPRRRNWLDTWKLTNIPEQNIFCEPCKDFNALMLYFLHRKNPEKYQYELTSICANFEFNAVDNIESNEHLDTYNTIINIIEKKDTWRNLFKTNPKLIFSAGSLKTAHDLIKNEDEYYLLQKQKTEFEKQQAEFKKFVEDMEDYYKSQRHIDMPIIKLNKETGETTIETPQQTALDLSPKNDL